MATQIFHLVRTDNASHYVSGCQLVKNFCLTFHISGRCLYLTVWSLAFRPPSTPPPQHILFVYLPLFVYFLNPKVIDGREPRIFGPLNAIRNMWGSLPDWNLPQARHLSLVPISLIPDALFLRLIGIFCLDSRNIG